MGKREPPLAREWMVLGMVGRPPLLPSLSSCSVLILLGPAAPHLPPPPVSSASISPFIFSVERGGKAGWRFFWGVWDVDERSVKVLQTRNFTSSEFHSVTHLSGVSALSLSIF